MGEWMIAVAILAVVFLPVALLLLVGLRRNWSFRKLGAYAMAYCSVVVLGLLAGLGARGWMLVLGVLVSAAGGGLVFMAWSRIIAVGEDARARRLRR